ncbi:diguanylate cyclase [Actinokineospora sp. G85]|uniref:GGDEF domain-containing protein n=1 Tax=Actinokineospora sp. G85 TaxID=3406626 RepID=UPI003C72C990
MTHRDVIAAPRRWALWAQRPRVTAYCLLSELLAVAATIVWWRVAPPTGGDVAMACALAGLGVLQAELGRTVERVRRRVSAAAHINMTSVWTMAGVLLLPPVLTAALTVVLYTHLAVRSWYRLQRVPLFRTVNNACVIILTCHCAAATLTALGTPTLPAAIATGAAGTANTLLALAVYFTVNALLVLPARTTVGSTPVELFGGWPDNALEVATLCLGTLNALALATQPGLALLILPPLLILHRAVLVRQLEAAVNRDAKTGTFSLAGWHTLAERALAHAERTSTGFGVLMVDLDHFKQVNDTHGHLTGDLVLHATAAAITDAVRADDAVGRFGGEEFVVLLPHTSTTDLAIVAERIRRAVTELTVHTDDGTRIDTLSVSIGTALYPTAGTDVQRLIRAADQALYRAKDTGRNRVVHTTAPSTP